jgi:serine/threonine-protein kinase
VLYEALTGRLPFEARWPLVVFHIANMPPTPPSRYRADLDPELEAICLKALAKKPHDRFASAVEFAAVLRRWLAARKPAAGHARRTHDPHGLRATNPNIHSPTPQETTPFAAPISGAPAAPRRRWLIAGLVLALLALTAGAAIYYLGPPGTPATNSDDRKPGHRRQIENQAD